MASLYNRASPPQERILRIVEGAIKNAAHAHSEIQISARHRRSIAKRAAGTLTAGWSEVLATTRRSEGSSPRPGRQRRGAGSSLRSPTVRALIRLSMKRVAGCHFNTAGEAGAPQVGTALPLLALAEECLKACAGPIRKRDDAELYDAVVTVLRLIGRRRKDPGGDGVEQGSTSATGGNDASGTDHNPPDLGPARV